MLFGYLWLWLRNICKNIFDQKQTYPQHPFISNLSMFMQPNQEQFLFNVNGKYQAATVENGCDVCHFSE